MNGRRKQVARTRGQLRDRLIAPLLPCRISWRIINSDYYAHSRHKTFRFNHAGHSTLSTCDSRHSHLHLFFVLPQEKDSKMILFRPPSLPLSLLSRRAAIPRPGRLPHARFTSSTSQPSGKPPGLFRRTYYKDGKFNKHAFGVTGE